MCSLCVVVVAVEFVLLIAVTLAAGKFLAIAALSLIAHNLYLGALITFDPRAKAFLNVLSGC